VSQDAVKLFMLLVLTTVGFIVVVLLLDHPMG
jgi:hypothetical protein